LKKVLFIAAHRKERAPNQRFRFEQYIDFLNENGFECHLSHLISEEDDKIFYSQGHLSSKAFIALKAAIQRTKDVIFRNNYDIIFICREGFLTGTTLFESLLTSGKSKTIFDFDDAIWHFDVSDANKKLGWLKNPAKTAKIIGMVDHVIAGNNYLANYASSINKNVSVIPTTIDTEYHVPLPEKNFDKETVCIGWTGSLTTVKHFRLAEPFLKSIKEKYGSRVSFKLIGEENYFNEELDLKGTKWTLEREVKDLHDLDIGIMPLPDDEWAKGKCGFKGLQYMAMEVPPIMSPVGVNTEIVKQNYNGLLATTNEDWFNAICYLIENPEERKRMGINARKTIIERYSVASQKENYLHIFKSLTNA
jgi:glycosyltransferase involved in cell wall biosynthesis